MKKLIRKLFGVAIGVTWVLALTLKFWGPEFYKVIPAIFSGIIIGLFIADYKEAWHIIFNSKSLFIRNAVPAFKLLEEIAFVIFVIMALIWSLSIWVISLVLGVILSPLYILKQVADSQWALLVALAITIGGLLGTFYSSYPLGLTSAVVSFVALSAIKKLLSPDYLRFFFYYKDGLPGYATFHAFGN